jgi:uncharacterized protein YecE (DUF72 family)
MALKNPGGIHKFYFRDIHPQLFIGTCSDRYAGWIGQIYSENRYDNRIKTRPKIIKGKRFVENVLPVESVEEYFEHFPVLEIDFTFYRILLDKKGSPTSSFHVLKNYSQFLKKEDRIVLKVPQAIFARKIRKGKTFADNENYLNAEMFIKGFYEPASALLGKHLQGFIFEQEYQRKDERTTPEGVASDLKTFFHQLPSDSRFHVELRTPRLLSMPVFDALGQYGVGVVLSHWTWLPPLRDQFKSLGEASLNKGSTVVIRLLTPRRMDYNKTYSTAFPFDSLVAGMLNEDMIEDTVEIIRGVVRRGKQIYLLVNNRSGGNAPVVSLRIASRLEETNFFHSNRDSRNS